MTAFWDHAPPAWDKAGGLSLNIDSRPWLRQWLPKGFFGFCGSGHPPNPQVQIPGELSLLLRVAPCCRQFFPDFADGVLPSQSTVSLRAGPLAYVGDGTEDQPRWGSHVGPLLRKRSDALGCEGVWASISGD